MSVNEVLDEAMSQFGLLMYVFLLPWVLVFQDIQEVLVHQVYPEITGSHH